MQKINVYGLGYIGLPTASLLAKKGYDVLGVDISPQIIETINQGSIHIVEPDLDVLVRKVVAEKKLVAALVPEPADIHIIAVPTPFKEEYQPNLSFVESVVKTIASVIRAGDLVVLESTSPVGTTEKVRDLLSNLKPGVTVYIAYSPERVIPGQVLRELTENSRIVGGIDKVSTQKAKVFYETFVEGEVQSTDARTAEMCKLTENSFRDVNIAFANELSLICKNLNINVWELIRLANCHPRVDILQPGPGAGGHCIAVDPWFIVAADPKNAQLIRKAREVNDNKPHWVINQVLQQAQQFESPVIACMGVTFKADVDDLRESPSLRIAQILKQTEVGKIIICDPYVEHIDDFELLNCCDAIKQADILLFLVEHSSFKLLSKGDLTNKCVIDTKGIFEL